jgi:hypothetical protein
MPGRSVRTRKGGCTRKLNLVALRSRRALAYALYERIVQRKDEVTKRALNASIARSMFPVSIPEFKLPF